MSANFNAEGTARQLDRPPVTDELASPDDVKDPKSLARIINRLSVGLVALQRKWLPRRIDFEDIVLLDDGTTLYTLAHNLGGRVRWWPVDWSETGGSGPLLTRDASSTDTLLVLRSYAAGTVTIRVEASG